jgi:hypothetical protein
VYDSRNQTHVPARTVADQSADCRLVLARVHRIAMDYAGGYREGLSRAAALTELADLSAGPDLLAQAAAMHAVAENWYAINAVDLLLEAGAPTQLVDSYLDGAAPDAGSTVTDPAWFAERPTS